MSPTRALLAFALVAPAALLAGACAAVESLGTGAPGGGAGAGATASDASVPEAGITGEGCGIEQTTGTKMCRGTSVCPGLVVDPEAFPRCGFRIGPMGASLVCACSGSLCPMKSFATCAEAAAILRGTTEAEVCVQLGEGTCSDPASAGEEPTSTCDRQCLAECGGGAGCGEICGCS